MSLNKHTIHLAYAEDHAMVRKGLINLLSLFEEFSVIIEAEDGDDLIDKLEKSDCTPDICLLDLNMPRKNGFETLKVLRCKWPEIKVLVLSLYSDEAIVIRMIRHGASGYISKSCSIETLRDAINMVYRKNYYHSELLAATLVSALHDKKFHPNLSEKEMQFLWYCCGDKTYKEIAATMNLSSRTIEGYRDLLFDKLKLKTRIGLAMYAIRTGIVPPF